MDRNYSMRIFICTHGRFGRQLTYDNLPESVQQRVEFVIQQREAYLWEDSGLRTLVVPDEIRELPSTREWLQHHTAKKIVMLDDDLVFSIRRTDDPTKFRRPLATDLESLFTEIEDSLDDYAHVGVSHREGANRNTDQYLEAGRMMRILAYNTDVIKAEGVISNRVPDVEDFDVTLQLLKKGYPNRILNGWVHNQGGSNQEGGCSDYRTPETHDRDVRIFASFHEGFVKVVKKKTKDNWCADENGERTDVVIQWKRAFKFGQANLLDQRAVLSKAK